MRIASIIALCLAITVALACIVSYMAGAQLRGNYRSRISITLPADEAAVWAAITDYAAVPSWWPAVTAVRTQKLSDGTEITWNRGRDGRETPFRTQESLPTERLARVIARDAASPGIAWEFTLAKAPVAALSSRSPQTAPATPPSSAPSPTGFSPSIPRRRITSPTSKNISRQPRRKRASKKGLPRRASVLQTPSSAGETRARQQQS